MPKQQNIKGTHTIQKIKQWNAFIFCSPLDGSRKLSYNQFHRGHYDAKYLHILGAVSRKVSSVHPVCA